MLLTWLGAHLACVLLEEGLSSPFSPDTLHAPLPEGAHPFYDGSIREMVRACVRRARGQRAAPQPRPLTRVPARAAELR